VRFIDEVGPLKFYLRGVFIQQTCLFDCLSIGLLNLADERLFDWERFLGIVHAAPSVEKRADFVLPLPLQFSFAHLNEFIL